MSEPGSPRTAPRGWIEHILWFCLSNKLVVVLLLGFFILWGLRTAPFDWNLGGLPRDPVET